MFCDIDPESLRSIEAAAKNIKLEDRVKLFQQDGLSCISSRLDSLGDSNASDVFVFLDPYQISLQSAEGMSSVDVFVKCLKKGTKAALWYGFDSTQDRQKKQVIITEALKKEGLWRSSCNIWWGEIVFQMIDNMSMNPGVQGG